MRMALLLLLEQERQQTIFQILNLMVFLFLHLLETRKLLTNYPLSAQRYHFTCLIYPITRRHLLMFQKFLTSFMVKIKKV
jgi:hypothetical protein